LPCGRAVGQCGGSGLDGHAFHQFQGRAAKRFECFQYLKGKHDVFTQVASRLRQPDGAQRAHGVAQSDPQESALKPVFCLMAADISVLRSDYNHLRAQLEALLAQPEKDMAEIDHLVDALERVQLDIKAELGLEGNNPNE
jgi:hypothetical protein